MLLWLTFAALAALVGWLLMRTPAGVAEDAHAGDLAVYRDQLAELESDAARGLIGAAEAQSARTEIARRMLKTAEQTTRSTPLPSSGTSTWSRPWSNAHSTRILTISAAAIPLLSLALYLRLGAPELPSRPLSARISAPADPGQNPAAVNDIMAKIEDHLRQHPDDGRGWSVIAPAYLSQGRAMEAAQAYERAIALSGEFVERLAGLAKSNLVLGSGIVNEIARASYEKILKLDPASAEARFWLAIHQEQNGRAADAIESFRKLAADVDQASPWRGAAQDRIKALTEGKPTQPSNAAPAPPAPQATQSPGPLRTDPAPSEFVAAAQKLAPEMREAMIGGRMIPKAEAAVKQNPKDFAAWSRIVTGHVALGHPAEARTALADARKAAEGDSTALAALDKLAAELGLNS